MAQSSVAQFASELKVPPSVLLEQLRAAGVEKRKADDALTEQDKSLLLEYLRRSHGTAESKNKITLTRKQTSEIKKSDASGKLRTVQVEVRKKRVFVKRDPAEVAAAAVAAEVPAAVEAPAPPPAPAAPAAPVAAAAPPPTIDAREKELRAEEARRHSQLSEIQEKELREKQERERKDAEQRQAQRDAPPPAPAAAAAAPTDGTLHAPKVKADDRKGEKRTRKARPTTVLRDDASRRRMIKTRGDAGGGIGGWHARGGGRHRGTSSADTATSFSAPTEPVVRD
ncbi:MAG TPA: translation initiation factor IF-2 associated domain-containing protein, partial [Burkholderiales bacterium]